MRNVHRVHITDIWSWYRVELRVGDHLGRSEELVSRCVECDLAEPESLASLGGSAPGVVDGILSTSYITGNFCAIVVLFVECGTLIDCPYLPSFAYLEFVFFCSKKLISFHGLSIFFVAMHLITFHDPNDKILEHYY